jgi:hypothetical protein
MASSRRTEEELKAMMPHKTIPSIGTATARPTWQSIKKCRALLAENAASIPSRLGDVELGHAAIIVGTARYTELSDTDVVYIIPQEPSPPIYTVGMSYHQREELKREYEHRINDNYTYKAIETILTKMYLDAVHEDYKTNFFTEELGYRCSFTQLNQYMEINFNKKTSQELADNESSMKQPWAADAPIEALFRRIDACRRFDPSIPEETIVRNTVDIICINDGFDDSFKNWNARPDAEKIWDNLKEHFGNADKARARIMALKTSVPSATYPGSANSITATIPPSDRLVSSIVKLLVALSASANGTTTAATTTTTATPRTEPRERRPHVPRATNPAGGSEPTIEQASAMSYCWSHGFCKRFTGKEDHTSASCDRHRIGHQAEATATNKMGRETRICNSWPGGNWRERRTATQQRE